ncbi:MAG TPA: glutamate synthase subunit alpha, partial [Candidatus Merdibacter merdipullorum]|nr:glutamate synthase subunit alpha [Candidatus Merdibacter merdipullorum]
LDEAMKRHAPFICELPVHNTDRSFGTLLGSHVTSRYGVLPDDACRIRTIGSGGQSYGAFLPAGISLELEGDANDYFGKGLSGGRLVVHPSPKAPFRAQDNIIIGNVALYGATSGTAYVCGQAGERFAVRNSGATAVVEGCGDHALEYMTGGCVVILGRTGRNVAAGMSGGVAYILDEDHDLYLRVNRDLVEIEDVDDPRDIARLKEILTDYVRVTHSEKGSEVLEQFMEKLPLFRKIIPHDYRVMTENIERFMHDGCDEEEAQRRAFAQMYES